MNTVPQHLGKYELRERLGRGGMAEVWKAFDTQLHRFVALKILHADLQNDPEEIPRLVPMLDEQKVDMITGWRKDRQDTNFRRWQSRQRWEYSRD